MDKIENLEDGTFRKEAKDENLENTKITITVELERIFDPNRSKNNLMLTMDAASIQGEGDDEPVADVLHGIPCHTVIRDKEKKEDWVLNYLSLYNAYEKARKAFDSMEKQKAREEEIKG